jgi:hypothetical protein
MRNEDIAPSARTRRPRTPAGSFPLFELTRDDDELVATGSEAQMRWDAEELTHEARADGDDATVYVVAPAA